MAGVHETQRRRVAGLFLAAGLLLILVGLVMIALHRSSPSHALANRTAVATPLLLQRFLYVLILLVLLFSVSVLAFLRWSRHFRRLILRAPAAPTPVEDVWQMHRLPPDEDPGDADD